MIISEKERNLLIVVILLLLFAYPIMHLRERIDAIRQLKEQRETAAKTYQDHLNLISNRAMWEEMYKKNSNLMPVFEQNKNLETHWLGILDRLAAESGLSVSRRQALEEIQDGEVYEMPIECKEWEGSLDSLVKFLYSVHAEGSMLDVRKLVIRQGSEKQSGLRGSFTLYCAYLRGTNPSSTSPSEKETK